MKIRWSPEDADDFERIGESIATDNPEAAKRIAGMVYIRVRRASGISAHRSDKPPHAGLARIGVPFPAVQRGLSGH